MSLPAKKERKDLSADSLFQRVHDNFDRIPDHRLGQPKISLGDALMSGFAMFSLKDPSLLAFDSRRDDPNDNFRTIYGIGSVPCDTQMRTILDAVDPDSLRSCFTDVFRCLQRGKVLEDYVYLGGAYLLSLDGTTYHNSDKIHCESCLVKRHRNGVVSYYHQLLAASLVHPDLKEVIPLAPEPIVNRDGAEKNDCERNAARRWLKRFRREHPRLPVIVVEDALGSNVPHLRDLAEARAHFIIGVKAGDHAFLFQKLREDDASGQTRHVTQVDAETNILRHYRWHLQAPLNESNPERVDVLEYWEIPPDGAVQYFSWITDLSLTEHTVYDVMRGGRARWKIENEVFNTLKNQGYNLEHNYGHGKQNLSVALAMLMMLAFLVDQVQQRCCPLFRAAREEFRTTRYFWERMRSLFHEHVFASMADLLAALARGTVRRKPILRDSS